jgi:hypothetical protein
MMLEQNQFNWIPKSLHGSLPEDPDYMSSREIWVGFYTETLMNCRQALKKMYKSAVVAYVVMVVFGGALLSKRRGVSVLSGLFRLALIHGAVFAFGWLMFYRIDHSMWAKNIKNGRMFSFPQAPLPHNPSLPSTLPTTDDIMVFDDMQSEYMASYTRVLDVFHPGNKAFLEMVSQRSMGYDKLTPALQQQLRSDLLRWARQQARRVLVKNDENNWAVADDKHATRFVHKELSRRANPMVGEAIRQLDFLITETKFGYWRDTQLHRKHMPRYLRKLQDKVMRFELPSRSHKLLDVVDRTQRFPSFVVPMGPRILLPVHSFVAPMGPRISSPVRSFVVPRGPRILLPVRSLSVSNHTTMLSQEDEREPVEPWIKEGDVVEANYGGLFSEWYRATITGANSNTMTWEIEYADGEEDFDLCRHCVRRFRPYEVGDEIEWRAPDMVYRPCVITAVNDDGTFDIKRKGKGKIKKSVSADDFRRTEEDPFADILVPGVRIQAKLPDYEGWWPGELKAINSDRTFAIEFDDGDFVQQVDPRAVRPEEV